MPRSTKTTAATTTSMKPMSATTAPTLSASAEAMV